MSHLLDIKNLSVTFSTRKQTTHAVRKISFSMGREKLGIVGESGSGKSVTGRSILGLIRPPGKVDARRLVFDNTDLLTANQTTWKKIRGKRITMVMQDPKYSLNPVMTVGRQIKEAYSVHCRVTRGQAREKVLEVLRAVRIQNPERVYNAYPHEVSGGMGQRIMLAMMLVPDPDLLIADELTSALDVTVQLQLLAILDDLVTERGMGLIFISHDLELVSSFCDRVVIMYAGQIMEVCDAKNLDQASHPYTRGLLNCLPRIDRKQPRLPVLNRDPAWLAARP
jgi:peptide/nickel transport system ATP-binding protein